MEEKPCSPDCEFFNCGQRKLASDKGAGNPGKIICGWVGDPCEGSKCAYALCYKGRLRQDGKCGLAERTVPKAFESIPRPKRDENSFHTFDMSLLERPKIIRRMKRRRIGER